MLFNSHIVNQTKEKFKRLPVKMNTAADDEMALSEHIEEFSQRTVFCIIIGNTCRNYEYSFVL